MTNAVLAEYQIWKQIDKYINDNITDFSPIVEICPKCSKVHPKLIKAYKAHSSKQMFRCKDCNKRFVKNSGQLAF